VARIVLRGGTVVDGSGAPGFVADVGIVDGHIAAVGPTAVEIVDARSVDVGGLVVAPGFIDMHAHSDLAVLTDAAHTAKVWQGVTLEVVGQDGLAYAPVTDETMPHLVDKLAAWHGAPALDYGWRSIGEYLDRVDDGAAVDVAMLVPHGNVRLAVVGEDDRAPSGPELARMMELVAEGMRDGAMGLSTGLTYTPAMFAGDDELVALLAPVAAAGGYYCPHHRNYGITAVSAYADCLAVSQRARVPLHLAHCHLNFAVNAGRAGELLALLGEARSRGVDVTLDTYPYLAGATYLASALPSWAQVGGALSTMDRLRDPVTRAAIIDEVDRQGSDGHHGVPVDWSTVVVTSSEDASTIGRSLEETARSRGVEPVDVFCDLLLADKLQTGCLEHVGNEENVRAIMLDPGHTAGTDGILVGERPHPRGWGTFPTYVGTYVRDYGVLTLEDCVAHLTSRPARRLGLRDRGTVKVGARADLVMFDRHTVAPRATYGEPCRQPAGIVHVMLAGEFTLYDGRRTAAVPGRSVRGRSFAGQPSFDGGS
jgi:N-acyl-D-amino-acid deacylase